MGLWESLFGGDKSSKEVRNVRLSLEASDGTEIVQGQPASLKLKVKLPNGTPLKLRYLQFDLINRREEKKTLLEKMVTQSRFVYRFNLERDLQPDTEAEFDIQFVPPICREGTRKTKFVTILWELAPSLVFAPAQPSEGDYKRIGEHTEVVIRAQ